MTFNPFASKNSNESGGGATNKGGKRDFLGIDVQNNDTILEEDPSFEQSKNPSRSTFHPGLYDNDSQDEINKAKSFSTSTKN